VSIASIDNKKVATLTGDKVRARTAPSTTNSKVLIELNKNTELTVLEETDKWVKLALKDYIAWTPIIEKNETITQSTIDETRAATAALTETEKETETDKKTETAEIVDTTNA